MIITLTVSDEFITEVQCKCGGACKQVSFHCFQVFMFIVGLKQEETFFFDFFPLFILLDSFLFACVLY